MRIVKHLVKVALISVLLLSVISISRHPHKTYYDAKGDYVFSPGNAPDGVRSEILAQLHKFQDGYTHRDTAQVEPFMEQLFSRGNILVLGTMPSEIRVGHDEACSTTIRITH